MGGCLSARCRWRTQRQLPGPDSAGASRTRAAAVPSPPSPTAISFWLSQPAGLVGDELMLMDAARSAIARSLAEPHQDTVEEAAFGMLRLASASIRADDAPRCRRESLSSDMRNSPARLSISTSRAAQR